MALSGTLLLILSCGIFLSEAYTVYRPTIEPFYPRGFRMSVPAEEGVTLVAYHININKDFDGLEAGSIAKDILKVRNGRYVYTDTLTKLKKGDVIYYWVYVIYEGLGYHLLDQSYTVTDFYDENGKKIDLDANDNQGQSCQPSTTRVFQSGVSSAPCRNELIFQEDFANSNAFRRSKWQIVEQFSDEPDYEFVVYRDSPDNVNVHGNNLVLTPKVTSTGTELEQDREMLLGKCTGNVSTRQCKRHSYGWNILPPISSGRVNTKNLFTFVYGKIDIRAKLPKGDWIYPLLMLEPVNATLATTAQLRVASSPGNLDLQSKDRVDLSGKNLWGGNIERHDNSDRMGSNRVLKNSNEYWSNDFHDYQLEWTPDRVILRVDGEQYDEQYVRLLNDEAFYITLGVAVGGYGEFPDSSISNGYAKPWRNVEAKALFNFYNSLDKWSKSWKDDDKTLKVDRIRVWAL